MYKCGKLMSPASSRCRAYVKVYKLYSWIYVRFPARMMPSRWKRHLHAVSLDIEAYISGSRPSNQVPGPQIKTATTIRIMQSVTLRTSNDSTQICEIWRSE